MELKEVVNLFTSAERINKIIDKAVHRLETGENLFSCAALWSASTRPSMTLDERVLRHYLKQSYAAKYKEAPWWNQTNFEVNRPLRIAALNSLRTVIGRDTTIKATITETPWCETIDLKSVITSKEVKKMKERVYTISALLADAAVLAESLTLQDGTHYNVPTVIYLARGRNKSYRYRVAARAIEYAKLFAGENGTDQLGKTFSQSRNEHAKNSVLKNAEHRVTALLLASEFAKTDRIPRKARNKAY